MSGMNASQRVLATVAHREPDRVPFFLTLSMHGARELHTSIKDYFSSAEHVAEAQVRMQKRYHHDCLNGFFYGPIELEAFGGGVLFRDDGPPNSGAPIVRDVADIEQLAAPVIDDVPCLARVLKALRFMKAEVGDSIPIVGSVISPFSLPVMQMGFERYLDLLLTDRSRWKRLVGINEQFCVAWANAQLAAGASMICYFDPVSSPTIIPRKTYLETGFGVAKRTIGLIRGPVATHMGSGRCLSIVDDLAETGTVAIGVSAQEDLTTLKAAFRGRNTVVGNLNGVVMRRWSSEDVEHWVKEAIAKAGVGGGFILSDNHGEIPWQVPESVLLAMSDAVQKWGHYPLSWVTGNVR